VASGRIAYCALALTHSGGCLCLRLRVAQVIESLEQAGLRMDLETNIYVSRNARRVMWLCT
jgi:hypothetical protein